MADRSALESAAAAGIIRADQVGPLYSFLATGGVAASPAGEEDLRFIRNFHDVFLAIGIVLFAIGLAVGIGSYAAGAGSPQQATLISGGLSLAAAVVMWGLGELFASSAQRCSTPARCSAARWSWVLGLTAFRQKCAQES
jgi:hypothetical protein